MGNRGETSGTGVAFTRNPATGEKKLYGEYLMKARTLLPVSYTSANRYFERNHA